MTRAIISLILFLHWSQGTVGGDDVVQEPKIVWKPKASSADMNCTHNKGISYYQMYWYRQRPGETMRLIVFTVANSKPEFGDVDQKKFEAHKSDAESGSLKVKDLEPDDSAIYFCSVSETGNPAYFGNGTKLTVLDPKIKVSERDDINVTVIRPSGQESCKKTVTLVCVARNFYPDHVSIQWMVGSSSRTDGVATDPYATKQGEDVETFTISSRLKVPIREWQNAKNKFKCQVLFYNGTEYLEREDAVYGIAGSDYTREDYIQSSQVMKLAYGMFIAKSGLYGLVIFVFVWRKGSSGK